MYAKIIRTIEYMVNLDSPMWPELMTHQERLDKVLKDARKKPKKVFKHLEAEWDSITGQLIKGDDHA